MLNFLKDHWERLFFGLVGLAFLIVSFCRLYASDIAGASATFAMAFFSFIYSNLARFKRFKGLGFEAELWEDKQKEAVQLIDRLKSVVSVYTREVVMQRVMQGRIGGGANWKENWELYDELVSKHDELGQSIDFSELKRSMDGVFLFDIACNLYSQLRPAILKGRSDASAVINREYKEPIADAQGHGARLEQLREIPEGVEDLFQLSKDGDVAGELLSWANLAQEKLRKNFEVEVELPTATIFQLHEISQLHQAGPIKVTKELIKLSKR